MWTVLQNAKRTLNDAVPTCSLRDLVGRTVTTASGEPVGRLEDVVMRQRERHYPLITGIVADTTGGRLLFDREDIAHLSSVRIALRRGAVGAATGAIANDEMLLRRDLLGRWFTELATADLLRACDLELAATDEGWALSAVYTHPPRWFGFNRRSQSREFRGWHALANPGTETRRPRMQRPRTRPLSASTTSNFADLLESITAGARADAAAASAVTNSRRPLNAFR